MIVVCKSCAIYIVNPAVLFFAAKKSKPKMDILHSFSPFSPHKICLMHLVL